ncbi:hypothetical protein I4U23_025816 [Adineta vaga]|nr:hypothetical protein I4U23_025816 [Adineta vaga]
MNLLIEQRSTSITSKLQQTQSQLSNENDVNNSLSSSPLILKIKRQSNSLPMTNEDNNTNNQRLKRPIPNSTTRRPSSPAFNGKQQVTKRSMTIDNNNNDLTPNLDDSSLTKRFKQDDLNQSSSTKVDASVETVSIGLATEPDQLGPCEPGTSVVLEGIVWNETDSGVLVVNVTWRGKTYVGTLLDSTKQDWACPRLVCESPNSDYDARHNSKTSRTKRTGAGGTNRFFNSHSTISSQQYSSNNNSSGTDDRKLRNNIKTRQSKRTNLNSIDETTTTTTNTTSNTSSPLASPFPTNTTFFPSSNSETQLISCTESQCLKRFVSTIALNYHLSNAHKKSDANLSTPVVQQASTRDEEDVAHILANVADYVRRPSPRSSPDHQRPTTLTWPCPQISSNLVLSSPLINNEPTIIPIPTNPTRCILNNTETNSEQEDVKPADHFLLHIQDESWANAKNDSTNENKKTLKIPTPSPSSFVPINSSPTIPPTSSSPAYSDISDEDPTTTTTTANTNNEFEQKSSPSTINLLTATNGKIDDNDQSTITNPPWAAQMLLQQYGSYMQQQTSNSLNSKINSDDTSDSTVKNILDSRRLSTTKPSSPSSINDSNSLVNNYQTNLYQHQSTDSKSTINSLTLPNENLLHPSTTDSHEYSSNITSSSSIHPSR